MTEHAASDYGVGADLDVVFEPATLDHRRRMDTTPLAAPTELCTDLLRLERARANGREQAPEQHLDNVPTHQSSPEEWAQAKQVGPDQLEPVPGGHDQPI